MKTTLAQELAKITRPTIASVVVKSDVHERMTKKSRLDKTPRPEWAEGLISLTRYVVRVGNDYGKWINNHLAQTGFAPVFEADKSNVSEPIPDFPNEILRQGVHDKSKLYVRLYPDSTLKNHTEVFYINAKGEDVTSKVDASFKEAFFPIPSGSVKQAEHGVSKEVQPRDYKAENILYIATGECVFNDLNKSIMGLFNLELV